MQQFRTLDLAIKLYKECLLLQFPPHLKAQILRSSSSVALNLSEGRAKPTKRDQLKFFYIAMGSLRETLTALQLAGHQNKSAYKLADTTAAHLYKLIKNAK